MSTRSSFSNIARILSNAECAPLGRDEERKLLVQAKSKNPEESTAAKRKLVSANLRLVFICAKNLAKGFAREDDFEDIFSVSVESLYDAISAYNLKYKTKFSSYASIWISARVRQATRKKLGAKIHSDANHFHDIYVEDIVESASDSSNDDHSIRDNIIHNLMSKLSPQVALDEIVFNLHLEKKIKSLKLSDMEKDILYKRLYCRSGEEATLADIGQSHGYCRESVRKFELSLLKKLRKHLQEFL